MSGRLVNLGALSLYVQDTGGNGAPVFLLHYSGGTAGVFAGVVPHLADKYRVIVPELRGHGRSEKPETGYHPAAMAGDLALLMDELGVRAAHVVGSSLGAEVAVLLAAGHPDKVLSLVCEGAYYNEFGPLGRQGVPDDEAEARQAELREQRAQRVRPTYATPQAAFEAGKARWTGFGLWNAWFQAHVKADICRLPDGRYGSCFPAAAMEQYMDAYYDLRFEHYYDKISCPVLFMLPEEDAGDPAVQRCVSRFREHVASSRVEVMAGAPHALMHMTHAEEVSRVLLAFLAEQR